MHSGFRGVLHSLGLFLLFAMSAGGAMALDEIWIQSDWSGGAFAAIDSLDGDASPGELVMDCDPLDFRLLQDVTDFIGVWDLEVCHGLLYLAAGDYPMSDDFGDILTYDYATNSSVVDYSVYEQGIAVLRAQGDLICSPGIDNLGTHDWGNLYLNDGGGWVRKETIPWAVHVDDLAYHDGRIWVSTGNTDPVGLRGVLYSTDDLGDTWTEEFAVYPEDIFDFRRLYGIFSWNGSLFVQPDYNNPDGKVLFQDPQNGDPVVHEIGAGGYCIAGFADFQERLAYFTRASLNFWDGESWEIHYPPITSINFINHAILAHDERIYLGGYEVLASSDDGASWAFASVDSLAGREFEAIEVYHGRLFAGAVHAGELFVSAAPNDGELISESHQFLGPCLSGTLDWDALLQDPDACSIRFQLRSAISAAELQDADFLGPDGNTASWFESPGQAISSAHLGHEFFQYRARFESADARLAPLLLELRLDLELDQTAADFTPPSISLETWPNPCRGELHLRFAGVRPDLASLNVYDVSGRLVKRLDPAAGGLRWNGRDEAGRALPTGVYLIRLDSPEAPSLGSRVLLLR